jgi:CelD/BcsL family acetyltransferase involved in cellulose biosynthesis
LLEAASGIMARSWKRGALGKRIASDWRACAYWQRIAALGALRSYTLETSQGRPIAFMRSTQWNGTLFLDQTAYDREFAKDSPGTVLLHMILEDVIATDTPRRVDFGIGDYEYKRHFATRSTLQGPVVLVPRRFRPLAVMYVDQLRRELHRVWRGCRALLCLPSSRR